MIFWVCSLVILLTACGGSEGVQVDLVPAQIPVENCQDYCGQCTNLFYMNGVAIECVSVAQCDKLPCITIVDESLGEKDGKLTVGRYYSDGRMEVTTYKRTPQEVAETMAHEIGHLYGLPHRRECDNIMTQDSVCPDVRTVLDASQREYFSG